MLGTKAASRVARALFSIQKLFLISYISHILFLVLSLRTFRQFPVNVNTKIDDWLNFFKIPNNPTLTWLPSNQIPIDKFLTNLKLTEPPCRGSVYIHCSKRKGIKYRVRGKALEPLVVLTTDQSQKELHFVCLNFTAGTILYIYFLYGVHKFCF